MRRKEGEYLRKGLTPARDLHWLKVLDRGVDDHLIAEILDVIDGDDRGA
jgi:hypothetical protein